MSLIPWWRRATWSFDCNWLKLRSYEEICFFFSLCVGFNLNLCNMCKVEGRTPKKKLHEENLWRLGDIIAETMESPKMKMMT